MYRILLFFFNIIVYISLSYKNDKKLFFKLFSQLMNLLKIKFFLMFIKINKNSKLGNKFIIFLLFFDFFEFQSNKHNAKIKK